MPNAAAYITREEYERDRAQGVTAERFALRVDVIATDVQRLALRVDVIGQDVHSLQQDVADVSEAVADTRDELAATREMADRRLSALETGLTAVREEIAKGHAALLSAILALAPQR